MARRRDAVDLLYDGDEEEEEICVSGELLKEELGKESHKIIFCRAYVIGAVFVVQILVMRVDMNATYISSCATGGRWC